MRKFRFVECAFLIRPKAISLPQGRMGLESGWKSTRATPGFAAGPSLKIKLNKKWGNLPALSIFLVDFEPLTL
jgi:hypothetical protein